MGSVGVLLVNQDWAEEGVRILVSRCPSELMHLDLVNIFHAALRWGIGNWCLGMSLSSGSAFPREESP